MENTFLKMNERKVSSDTTETNRKVSEVLEDGYAGLVSSLQKLPIRSASLQESVRARSQTSLNIIRKHSNSLGSTFVKIKTDEEETIFNPDKPWLNALLVSPVNRKHRNRGNSMSITPQKCRSLHSFRSELSINPHQIKVF